MVFQLSTEDVNLIIKFSKCFIDPKSFRKELYYSKCTISGGTLTVEQVSGSKAAMIQVKIVNSDTEYATFLLPVPSSKFSKKDGRFIIVKVSDNSVSYRSEGNMLEIPISSGIIPSSFSCSHLMNTSASTFAISFNPVLLGDVLKNFDKGDACTMYFKDKVSPVIITQSNKQAIVLPMKFKENKGGL